MIVPSCVYNELKHTNDQLKNWVEQFVSLTVYDEYKDPDVWSKYKDVISYLSKSSAYQSSAIDNWKQVGKADPLLIAIAMKEKAAGNDCVIVTFEKFTGQFKFDEDNNWVLRNKKTKLTKEPKIPDVAQNFGIECIELYELEEELGLSI